MITTNDRINAATAIYGALDTFPMVITHVLTGALIDSGKIKIDVTGLMPEFIEEDPTIGTVTADAETGVKTLVTNQELIAAADMSGVPLFLLVAAALKHDNVSIRFAAENQDELYDYAFGVMLHNGIERLHDHLVSLPHALGIDSSAYSVDKWISIETNHPIGVIWVAALDCCGCWQDNNPALLDFVKYANDPEFVKEAMLYFARGSADATNDGN